MFLINEVDLFGSKKFFVTNDKDDHATYVSVELVRGNRTVAARPLNDFNLPPVEKMMNNVEEAIALVNVLEMAGKAERKTVEQVQTEALLTKPLNQDRIEKAMHSLLRKQNEPDPAFFRDEAMQNPLHDPYLLTASGASSARLLKNP